MQKLSLQEGKWTGVIPGGETLSIVAGDSIEVTDEQAAYLLGDDCIGAFVLSDAKPVKSPAKAPKESKD